MVVLCVHKLFSILDMQIALICERTLQYNTFGNLVIDPRAGLIFVDWVRGHTLQLTGKCRIFFHDGVNTVDASKVLDAPPSTFEGRKRGIVMFRCFNVFLFFSYRGRKVCSFRT
jgi:hypothetical protein